MSDFLKVLDAMQREAATSAARVTVVTAAPGSGKTEVIVKRVAWLRGQSVPAHKIQVITFSRSACAEIVMRLLGHGVGGVRVETAHSLGVRMLREDPSCAHAMGLYGSWRVASDLEYRAYLLGASTGPLRLINGVGRTAGATVSKLLRHSGELASGRDPMAGAGLDGVLASVWTRMAHAGVVPHDRIMCAFNSWRGSKGFAEASHLLMDEMQDCTPMEYRIAMEIGEPACTRFFVGDKNQAIYGWRGAVPELLGSFAGTDALQFRLNTSVRFGPSIAVTASEPVQAFIVTDPARLSAVAWMPRESAINALLAMHMEGSRDIALLVRTNNEADLLSEALHGAALAHSRVATRARSAALDRAVCRLRFIANPSDTAALFGLVLDGEGSALLGKILAGGVQPGMIASRWVEERGEDLTFMPEAELRAVDELLGGHSFVTPEEILDAIASAERDEQQRETEPHGIVISTVHAFKGREATHVFAFDWGAMDTPEGSEERRVWHVALTRARKTLVIVEGCR